KDGWHILYQNPGDAGMPVAFEFSRAKAQLVDVSVPEKFVYDDIITQYGFAGKAYYYFKLKNVLPAPQVHISWTACRDYCEPEEAYFGLVNQTTPSFEAYYEEAKKTFPKVLPEPIYAKAKSKALVLAGKNALPAGVKYFIAQERGIFDASAPQKMEKGKLVIDTQVRAQIPSGGLLITDNGGYKVSVLPQKPDMLFLLLLAFIGGVILNLMPCVFPVLSLKAIQLAKNSRQKKGRAKRAGLYVLGVLSSFLCVAGLLYVFKQSGAALGWGFQLQSSAFVFAMIVVFVLILLYLFNILKMKTDYSDKLLKVSGANAFLTGFFAVLIASPCTGPFMGAAMGFAMFESAAVYFPVFAALGLGYALPFALLEMYPKVLKNILPKPGVWMVRLKYILSIPIILTVIWLSWVFYHQLWQKYHADVWMPYSKAKVEAALENKEAVFIDFTAKWCLSCLLNEKTTLEDEDFLKAAKEGHIHLFKADWTNQSREIFEALKSYQRSSVPLYVFYPAGSETYRILPQILTPDIVLSEI
ncbi:MAG: thioredoxin family protein, partial [Elusimicrobiaceae bacterium]|nr:thioredoxin family protein [Elusimicrobiaceae bacterium]